MKINTLAAAASWCCIISSAWAGSHPGPKRPDGVPVKMEDFKWADPAASRRMKKFSAGCTASRTFEAKEYLLDDLSEEPPMGLKPWTEALKKIFSGREYPGSWDGIDPHGYDRNLLLMEYSEVPIAVREWIEAEERGDGEGKGLYAVYEKPKDKDQVIRNVVKFASAEMAKGLRPLDKKKVVIFAPGAVYDILPLWVAEGSDCKGKNPNSIVSLFKT